MRETRNGERAAGKVPDERRGWRRDEFARHEIYSVFPVYLAFAIVAIVASPMVIILLLKSCRRDDQVGMIHASQDLPSASFAWSAVPSSSSLRSKHVN